MQSSDREAIVEHARADLAQRLDLDRDGIEVRSVEEHAFRDTSLGVPEPGQMYAQAITPGYVIWLRAKGKAYEYHGTGERVVRVPDE
jgi:hypothetical protein